MKVFCAGLVTETNTFSTVPCDMDTFLQGSFVRQGMYGSSPHPYAQPLLVADRYFRQLGYDVVHGLFAYARPAGPLDPDTYQALKGEIIGQLRRVVVLVLHGAMATTEIDDCEGDILEATRHEVGSDCTIGAILDPHCHLTEKMVENASCLIFLKEYPHTDFIDRAHELCDILHRTASREVTPVAAVADCRMIGLFFTSEPATRKLVDLCQSLERNPGILSVSVNGGVKPGHGAEQKSATCGARMRPPGGRSPSGGLMRAWRFLRGFSRPFGRGFGRDDSFRRSSRGC